MGTCIYTIIQLYYIFIAILMLFLVIFEDDKSWQVLHTPCPEIRLRHMPM